ncbi:MAG: C4-type zinc ribbon domain-containing protein [Calditrichia bacterium]
MKKLVGQLVALQDIDSRYDILQLQKGDLPMMIEQAESDLQDKKERKSEMEEKVTKGEADRRMFQTEIEASKDKLKKYEDQLYKVQTNKEYDAISLEIDTKKMEVGELENKILQSLEEEEELKSSIEEVQREIGNLEEQLKGYHRELADIMHQTATEEKRLQGEREKILKDLDKRYIRQYERIRKAKDGLAVVPIKKGSCGGCFSSIPPQRIVEIREMNRLNTCEHCGRIVAWVEGESDIS